ncbi:hypothetical protein ACWEAF_05790 [Streptomyces sp. NPDC005071]
MKKQTCSRHPKAGRFLATCPACTQELFDIEQANRAKRAAARAALTAAGYSPTATILSITVINDTMVIAHQDGVPSPFAAAYAVDTFRLPTVAEVNPEQDDPRTPGQWVLIDQYATDDGADIARMKRDAFGYLADLGLVDDLDLMALAA